MKLSPRHREIIQLVGKDGCTYREVAERLGISRKTVEAHISVIVRRARMPDLKQREVLLALWENGSGA